MMRMLVAMLACCLVLANPGCRLLCRNSSAPIIKYTETVTTSDSGGTETVTKTEAVVYEIPIQGDPSKATLPKIRLTGSGAEMGSAMFQWFQAKPTPLMPLSIAGGAPLILGIALARFVSMSLGITAALSGISLIVMTRLLDIYPWFGFIPFGMIVVTIAYALYRIVKGKKAEEMLKRSQTALSTVVQAIESLGKRDPTAATSLKASIEAIAGKDKYDVKKTVTEVKESISS
mgnify:CR=1 FL=1